MAALPGKHHLEVGYRRSPRAVLSLFLNRLDPGQPRGVGINKEYEVRQVPSWEDLQGSRLTFVLHVGRTRKTPRSRPDEELPSSSLSFHASHWWGYKFALIQRAWLNAATLA
ncbi:hypothetical protein NPIL_590621 [Nephila pilipes]|uniref:Uncharacterized protein n=1 Tax=Nephila pilipes TaxID=299642 RepID=A0A8X6NTF4_NEPPI|nr:hypothetical protein NPIL_590621 [Nephila pilipes]